jgi:hypothetical protein
MLTRRRIFVGGVASVVCAPAIVRAKSLMPIRALHCMEQLLKSGWTSERAQTFGSISENEARRQVTYAECMGCWCESAWLGARAFLRARILMLALWARSCRFRMSAVTVSIGGRADVPQTSRKRRS